MMKLFDIEYKSIGSDIWRKTNWGSRELTIAIQRFNSISQSLSEAHLYPKRWGHDKKAIRLVTKEPLAGQDSIEGVWREFGNGDHFSGGVDPVKVLFIFER